MKDRYQALLYLSDRSKANVILRRLAEKLSIRQGQIDDAEVSEAIGLTRSEIALTVVLSFTTSVVANLATPAIKEALDEIKVEFAEFTDYEVLPPINEVSDDTSDQADRSPTS